MVKHPRGGLKLSPGRVLAFKISKVGYPIVGLYSHGKSKCFCVHRLVASAFYGPCPAGKEVCHTNGQHTDNRACNLRYDTRKANIGDAIKLGTFHHGERGSGAKLTEAQARQIKASKEAGVDLARQYGISPSVITDIRRGRTWKHL
jgi:hypothetical protein